MIEHVMRAVMSLSDRIVVLNLGAQARGRLAAARSPNDPGVITAYLGDSKLLQRSGEAGVSETLLQVERPRGRLWRRAGALGHLAQGRARQHDHAARRQRRRQDHQPARDHRRIAPARRQGRVRRRGRDVAAGPRQGGARPRAGARGAAVVQQHERRRKSGDGRLFAPRPRSASHAARPCLHACFRG